MVVTRTTRNRFVLNRARGFESHHLRHRKRVPFWELFFYFGVDENPPGEYLTPQNSSRRRRILAWRKQSDERSERKSHHLRQTKRHPFWDVFFIFIYKASSAKLHFIQGIFRLAFNLLLMQRVQVASPLAPSFNKRQKLKYNCIHFSKACQFSVGVFTPHQNKSR